MSVITLRQGDDSNALGEETNIILETGEESSGHWLRDGDTADHWAEEPAPEIESIDAEKND